MNFFPIPAFDWGSPFDAIKSAMGVPVRTFGAGAAGADSASKGGTRVAIVRRTQGNSFFMGSVLRGGPSRPRHVGRKFPVTQASTCDLECGSAPGNLRPT